MAIYSEETDPNEKVPTSKDLIIEKINDIIKDYGSFTTADVYADHSPSLNDTGRLCHLAEDFEVGKCEVTIYDPKSHDSDGIDSYYAPYSDFEEDQLEYILTLAEKWVEVNVEEEE